MYITINDIIGEKRIDISYPIKGKEALALVPCKAEIALVSMISNNVLYWLKGPIEVLLEMGKKIVLNKVLNKEVYTDKELAAIIGQKMKLPMDDRDDVLRTSKLDNATKMFISLNELDNSDNLEDGRPSNTLFTYYVTGPEYFTHFKPCTPQYKKLKNDMITSLTLKITDQAGNMISNGPQVTVILHIKYNPL